MKKYALSLTSAFTSPSIIKARIVMMYQKTSHRIALSKFLLAIPVLALCLLVASFTQRKLTLTHKPNTDGKYQFLKSLTSEAKEVKKLNYIFIKTNEYLFRFVNTKTQETVSTPTKFRILDNDKKEMTCEKVAEGWHYNNQATGMYTVEFENENDNSVSLLMYFRNKQITITKEENGIFESPEILPTLPIFIPIKTQNEYPKEAFDKEIEGEAIVSSIVNIDGTISDIKIEKSLGYGCDEVALEKVRNLKNIVAGKHKGKNVRTKMRTRVDFAIYPLYSTKAEMPTQVLQSIPFSTTEAKITLEKGKKYIFTISELEGLSKEDLEIMNVSLDAKEGFQIAFINTSKLTFVYKPKETGEFKIKLNNGKPLKAGKLVIGTK